MKQIRFLISSTQRKLSIACYLEASPKLGSCQEADMLSNLTALPYHYSGKPDDVFSLCVACSNATCSEIFTPESLGVDLPSLNKTELCLLF